MAAHHFFPDAPAAMPDASSPPDRLWRDMIATAKGLGPVPELPPPWRGLFGPLLADAAAQRPHVVAQLGQSLDGRIATPTGHSHYINGPAALAHLHRLRALVDAVVIGVGTAIADDPRLTVRSVAGPDPVRVVIDPSGRLPPDAKLLARDGVRCYVVTREAARVDVDGAEIIRLPADADGRLRPAEVLDALRRHGLRTVLVEGGTATVSGFLAAGCLDRLHVMVAPLIIGSGPVGLTLPPIDRLEAARRPPTAVYRLGDDLLFDCDLRA